jgi:hypothetical protein
LEEVDSRPPSRLRPASHDDGDDEVEEEGLFKAKAMKEVASSLGS